MALMMTAALMVSSCASTQTAVNVVDVPRVKVTGELKRPCSKPVVVPAGKQSRRDVQRRWNTDRQSLRECGSRHGELARQITKIEGAN